MIIPKFVWRGTSIAKTVLKVKTKVRAIGVSGETWRAGAVIPTVVPAERGTQVSGTDPKLVPHKAAQPVLVEAQKQSNKGRLASHVWCWHG